MKKNIVQLVEQVKTLQKLTGKKVVFKELLKEESKNSFTNIKYKFEPNYDEKKNLVLTAFKGIKSKIASSIKILSSAWHNLYDEPKFKKWSNDNERRWSLVGTCNINNLEALLKSATRFTLYEYDKHIELTFKYDYLQLYSKQIYAAALEIEMKLETEKQQKKAAILQQMKANSADLVAKIPDVTLYIYELGQSRGDNFSSGKVIKAKEFFKKLYTLEQDDFFEKTEPFNNIFYNNNDIYSKADWQKDVANLVMKVIKTKKPYIESWEEGTTGIGIDKSVVTQAVKKTEFKSRAEMDSGDW